METNNSENIKQLYLNCEDNHKRDINKIKMALSNLLDNSNLDNLLDTLNYTNATYNTLKMQYLILYASLYLKEKKIIQNNDLPINTSLKLLLSQDWITQNTKDFLNKHYHKVLKDNLDYSQYLVDINTYLNNSKVFN